MAAALIAAKSPWKTDCEANRQTMAGDGLDLMGEMDGFARASVSPQHKSTGLMVERLTYESNPYHPRCS